MMACTLCALPAGAQDASVAWDEFAASYAFDFASHEEAGGMSVEEQLEQLYVIHLAPMDLNTAGRDDLLQLPFIDGAAADSLLAFRERHGPFRSMGDLQFVRGLDYRAREWLPVFVCCAAPAASRPSVSELLTQGRWEVNGMLGVPLYRRAGNRSHSADELEEYPNRQYLGNGLSHTLRLNYSAAGRLDYGLKFDKDAGEPFARRGNRPYDEYAFYVALHPVGRWRDVVAGDYRVNVGEGLLLGNSFMVDKASVVAAYRPPVARVSPTLSSGGANLMRGLAATWAHGGWAWSAFTSYRKADANLDTAGRVTSLKTDGYHRTPLERSKRRNLGVVAAGGAAEYGQDDWRVGMAVTAVYYDRPLAPRSALYSRYYPRGHWLGGVSAYYGMRFGRWASRGEVAVDRRGHVALAGRLSWQALPDWRLAVAGRKLTVRFASPAGQTLQEGGRVANEEGVLVASQFRLPGGIEGEAYVDLFRFPWSTYRASQPSKGMEVSSAFSYRQGRKRTWTLRYRMNTKQRDVTGHDGWMEFVATHRLRLAVEQTARRWTWTAAADGAMQRRQTGSVSLGTMASGRVTWTPDRWRLAAMGALFFTDDYATSLSVYQPGFAQTFGFVRGYYHGAAAALLADWQPVASLHFGLRYSLTAYFNRDVISSGTQQIDAPTKSDLLFRVAWKF